ncbi:adhesion G protein-coupled receptor B1-like [Mytilus californianus]|uniref:adhesion G protein-coupled receptor B1-like n=1 Tax=Mytilus californianus TaxID=6549 RepID=UPI0022470F31|nr:adhesion G protein-coupled receptor B1-like [Mytilus californianus]
MEWLWWFLNIFLIQNIASIDFRGGVITWKYIVTENEMAVTYNLSYRPIDSNNICSPYELGNGTWCGEEDPLGCCNDCNMTFRSYYCTSYNNDNTIGEMTRYIPSYETYDNKLIFGYEACCWKDLVEGGDLKTISMVTKVDLTIRTDTGMVNTSPISAIQPVVRVKQGCSFSIHIQVKDDDGDIVKCRWANNKTADECGGICNGLSGSIMNVETCILSYNATGSTGWYAVALQIEDFVSQSDIDPLSSVSLQFLIFVYSSTETCDNRPSIDTSTDKSGALILILSNTTYHKTIIASTHSINSKISEINTVSPIGMTKSALLKYGLVESQWYINVTWTPKETHIGSHQFCYAAFDTNRQVSDQICITLKVINNPAHFCPVNLDSFKTIWNLAQIDTNVSVSCSGFYTGIVSRYCDRRGQWEEPDYSQCTKIAIQSLKEQSSNLIEENNTATEVSKILEDLNIITWNNITSGDLVTSSNILKDIADFVAENTDALTKNQIEIFGSLCNNLLGDNNDQNWEQLRKKDSSSITGIVKAVTDYSKSFTNVLHSEASIIIQKENIFIQLGKVHSKDIVVPDRTKTSESWVLNSINEISLSLKCFYGLPITGYSSTFYRNISKLFPESLSLNNSNISDVNSIIADFSIEPTPARIYYPVVIKFQYLSEDYSNPICVFLNFNMPGHPNGAWSTVGSRVVESTDTYTICEFTHTTNFAILMSPGKTPHAHTFTLSLISTFGCIISVLFLIITVIVYFVLWRHVRSDRAKILINLCLALITSYILFLVGINRTGNKVVCTAIAVALHYMFLVDFALMLGEGIQVAIMVVIIFRRESILQWMLPLCYVIPAAIVSISAGVTKLQGYGNRQFCWLTVESKLIWAFVAPALFVVMMNMVILVIMIYKLLTIRGLSAKTLQQKAKAGIKSICVIFPLFGITWVLGAFSVNEDLVVFQYLFAVFNSLQGFFICLFHCFLNQQVKQGYEHFQRRRRAIRLMESKSLSSSDYQTRKTRVSTDQTSENRGRSNEEEILKGRNYAYTFKTDSKFYNPTFSQ